MSFSSSSAPVMTAFAADEQAVLTGRRVTRDAAVLRDPAGAVGAVVPRH